MTVTADALGLRQFNKDIFEECIISMRISEANKIVYTFSDEHEVIAVWQDRSRSESWTDEMKAAARGRAKGGGHNG